MRRTLLVFALATSLVATGSNRGFFRQLWDGLAAAWGLSATADEGCGVDPNGRCLAAPQSQGEEGCGVDPDGKCSPAKSDAGCGMDPYGGCAPAPQPDADAGCGVDPNGCPKGS